MQGFNFSPRKEEELCFLLVFVLEFFDPAGGIHEHLLARKKRMGS